MVEQKKAPRIERPIFLQYYSLIKLAYRAISRERGKYA
jgi:hypothetical protein